MLELRNKELARKLIRTLEEEINSYCISSFYVYDCERIFCDNFDNNDVIKAMKIAEMFATDVEKEDDRHIIFWLDEGHTWINRLEFIKE